MSEKQLAKPQLRNLHYARIKKNLGLMVSISTLAGLAYKLVISDSYERRFEDFYKNYNAEESLKRMNKAGVMQSYEG